MRLGANSIARGALCLIGCAALVEYDAELIDFICRFTTTSPQGSWHVHDRQSIWMNLLVTIPTVYSSHVCVGSTKPLEVCSGLQALVSSFAPSNGSLAPCHHLVGTEEAHRNRRKKGGLRGLAYGAWSSRHVAETYPLRVPPPIHHSFLARPSPLRGSFVIVLIRAPGESRLTPADVDGVLQHVASLPDCTVLFGRSSLFGLNATDADDLRETHRVPAGVLVPTREMASEHGFSYDEFVLLCMARARLFITEPDWLAIASFYFASRHLALVPALPDFITRDLLVNLAGQELELFETSNDLVAAVRALRQLPPELSPPARHDVPRARPRALSRPASAPVPAVVCRTLSNWSLEPFHGEFGPELITALPHAYFFHACDKLEATSSCGDLRSLYFFSPKHTVLDCERRAGGQLTFEGIFGLYSTATPVTWVAPPLRSHVRATTPDPMATVSPAGGPRILIFNRIDCNFEDGSQSTRSPSIAFPADKNRSSAIPPHFNCKQYIGTRELDVVLRKIFEWNPRATVVYHRADSHLQMPGFSSEQGGSWESVGSRTTVEWVCPRLVKYPCARIDAIEDWAFLSANWPRVLRGWEVMPRNTSWNAGQNVLMSWSDCFVSVQGGGSYLASFFGGHNIVVNAFGERRRRLVEAGVTYDTVLPRLSNQSIREVRSAADLYDALDAWRRDGRCGLGVGD